MQLDEQWREELVLDGVRLELRVLRAGDAPLLAEGFDQLSDESRYRRFFSPKPRLSDEELHYLTHLDGWNHFAIGVVRIDDAGREHGAGVARFVRCTGDPRCAEPAVTVIDALQGRGLGRILLERLVLAARERGIDRFESQVLAGNTPMRSLLRKLGRDAVEPVSETLDGSVVVVRVDIRPPRPLAAAS